MVGAPHDHGRAVRGACGIPEGQEGKTEGETIGCSKWKSAF